MVNSEDKGYVKLSTCACTVASRELARKQAQIVLMVFLSYYCITGWTLTVSPLGWLSRHGGPSDARNRATLRHHTTIQNFTFCKRPRSHNTYFALHISNWLENLKLYSKMYELILVTLTDTIITTCHTA